MAFKDGDFLEIEYTVWDAATNSVLNTTDEKKAKESDTYNSKVQYGPVLLVLGSPGVLKGLNRELKNMNEKETKKFTFKPDDAFGERSEELVRVMPISEFRQREIDPYPGMQVNIDDISATVKSVSGGRVVVDANHPFAGKDIIYEVKVIRTLTNDKDRIEALGKSYGLKPTKIDAASDKATIDFDDSVVKNADYFIGRASMIASAFSYLKNLKKIEIREEYVRKEEKKEEKK